MTESASDPTVQTPAGPPEGATGDWRVSLAEIDALGRKAARGAGYSWGMAEEAGRAARWLAAWRQPGPQALLAALGIVDGAVAAHAPRPEGAPWRSEAGRLCPICAGVALCDRAGEIAGGAGFRLEQVLVPLLIVPFLCRAARDLDVLIRLDGSGIELVATPDGPATLDWAPLGVERCDQLRVRRTDAAPCRGRRPETASLPVPVETWRGLDRFAHRTYAPATDARGRRRRRPRHRLGEKATWRR